jgi:hypothetical protein
MCFLIRSTTLALLMGLAVSSQSPCIVAQERRPVPLDIARDLLPDAPEPQSLSSPVGMSDEQPVAGQRQTDARESKKAHKNTQHSSVVDPSSAYISGTVTDMNGNIVPGASIVLEGPGPEDRRSTVASDSGAFQLDGLKPKTPYLITITAPGLESWTSQTILLDPGQYFFLTGITLKVPHLVTSVKVYATQEQIAVEQVDTAVKQRVFGFLPNFYVTYDSNPVPLTTRLKFKLALKADTDVMTFVGVAFMAAVYQAGDIPDYGQGAQGYAKRMAAGYADSTSDIFLGGAVLPSLFHQDPRYFYQGTGSKKSRAFHALSSPFVCKGDNGKTQLNYSSLGGDLASGAISNLYYPESDRGVGVLFQGFLVTTGVRTVTALVQEFLLRKLTPTARTKY